MPGQGRNHLQLAGIGFADAWLGLESSATCWNWICRCLARVGSICNLLKLELQMPDQGWNHLQFVGYEFADTYPGVGSICNLLELDLQMPGQGWKHLQLVGIGFADAYYQVDIKNPTTIEVGLFFYVEKRAKCSRGLAEHIVLKYNKASHFFLFFTENCILLSLAVRP